MSLNIKNEETCRLAGELARLTGETMTGAITVALRERLERERHERSVEVRVQRLRAIANRCAKLLGPGPLRRGAWRRTLRRQGVAQVIVDSSAVLAVLYRDPDAERFETAIASVPSSRMSVANALEASM